MSNKPTLLIVDDEPFNLEIMQELLEDDYELVLAENGQTCLDKVSEAKPDLILLDVNMPVLNGLNTCEQLKQGLDTAEIPVIFVSALSTIEERMAGYKAGGEDYITKPFKEEELKVKIELTLASIQAKENLQETSNEAMNMAMTAMTSASEIGQILQFIRDSYTCKSYSELATLTIELYQAYALDVILRINDDGELLYFSPTGSATERESAVFELVHKQGRFVDFGRRTAMNYDSVSVLVKNMPIDDAERYGRIKDNMGIMGEAVEARSISLATEIKLHQRKHELETLMSQAESMVNDIQDSHQGNSNQNEQILTNLLLGVEDAFITLGLSDAQEEILMSLLNKAQQESTGLYNQGFNLEEKLSALKNTVIS